MDAAYGEGAAEAGLFDPREEPTPFPHAGSATVSVSVSLLPEAPALGQSSRRDSTRDERLAREEKAARQRQKALQDRHQESLNMLRNIPYLELAVPSAKTVGLGSDAHTAFQLAARALRPV